MAKPVDIDEIPLITQTAVEWFGAAADLIGPMLEDKVDRVASSAAVFTAIGAMVTPCWASQTLPSGQRRRRRSLIRVEGTSNEGLVLPDRVSHASEAPEAQRVMPVPVDGLPDSKQAVMLSALDAVLVPRSSAHGHCVFRTIVSAHSGHPEHRFR